MSKEEKTKEKLNQLENTIGKIENSKQVKHKKQKKPTFSTSEVVVLLIITVIISLLMGFLVTYKFYNNINVKDDNLQEFIDNYEYITKSYYKDVDKEELLDAALDGMLKKLDKNSIYLEESASDSFNKQLNGTYEGFGIEIYNDEDGNIVVNNVYDNSSADDAGIKSGDIITKFNKKDLSNTTTSKFVKMVDSTKSKTIKVTYKRKDEEKTVTLTKKTVTLTSVGSKVIDEKNNIGYIRVSVFAQNTDEQFKKQLEKLESKNIKSLIIDLRSNSGGHLASAGNMISEFLDSSHVIYQIKTKENTTKHYSTGKTTKKYPIVILVDSNSASASEIMTSALKEQYGAIIIGEKTYGKGTVQEMQDLPNGDKYKITTKEWLTSKGKTINKKGIKPTIEEKLSEEYYNNPSDETDNQLQKALSELTK